MADIKEIIAARVAKELKDGDVVNLGIGLPTMVANFLPEGVQIVLQSENGIMGMGTASKKGSEDVDVVNAGAQYVTVNPGAMFFDSATSLRNHPGRPCGRDHPWRFGSGSKRKPFQLDRTGQDGPGHGRSNGSGRWRKESDHCYAAYAKGCS